jgi:hypothetical protein
MSSVRVRFLYSGLWRDACLRPRSWRDTYLVGLRLPYARLRLAPQDGWLPGRQRGWEWSDYRGGPVDL